MSTKRNKLLKTVGELVATHSRDDWIFVAENLESLASLARQCSAVSSKISVRAKEKKPLKQNRQRKRYSPSDPLVTQLGQLLNDRKLAVTASTVRTIAIGIGIKAELPKSRFAVEDMILKHLDESPERARQDKLKFAIGHLEGSNDDQSSDFQRWVSLITDKRS